MTQIVVGAVFGADCNCLALLRDGNRITKLVTVRFPDDVLVDLIPSVVASFVIAIQGVSLYVSWLISIIITPWRAKDDIVPLGSNIYRPPKQISGRISADGLDKLCPPPAIVVSPIET